MKLFTYFQILYIALSFGVCYAMPPSPPSAAGSGDMTKAVYDTDDNSAIDADKVATLNQNTTGSAGSIKSPATTGLATVTGMGAGTTRVKTVRDANDTVLEQGGSYTPTGTWDFTSLTGTWPTFNQNTTGTAGNFTTGSSVTCTDSGDANHGALTITTTGVSRAFYVTNNDAHGCNITLSETNAVDGQWIKVVNISANHIDITTSAGVQQIKGSPLQIDQWDAIDLIYQTNQWVQVGQATIRGITLGGFTASKGLCSDGSGNATACTNLTDVTPLTSSTTIDGLASSTSANLRTTLSDEIGAGAALFHQTTIDGSAHVHLTAAQMQSPNCHVSNYGQAAADVNIGLPTAAANLSCLFTVSTAQSNHWGVLADTNDGIYIIAADGTISAKGDDAAAAVMTAAQLGQSFACYSIQTGASAWDWMCKAIAIGTSTFAAHAAF